MNFKVGQIIFMCSDTSIQVIPLLVVEEIIKTSLNGTDKSYAVQFPNNNNTVVNISKLKGKVFNTIADVETFMTKNSNDAIKKMINTALILKSKVFEKEKKDSIAIPPVHNSIISNEKVVVDLGNGVKGNINLESLEKLKYSNKL